jgi:hypothetical protein
MKRRVAALERRFRKASGTLVIIVHGGPTEGFTEFHARVMAEAVAYRHIVFGGLP